MNEKPIKILAIETSCDETSAAVIFAGGKNTEERKNRKMEEQIPAIISNIISSQIDLHAKTGGVVPEVASRAHMEAMIPVIEEALMAGISNDQLSITNNSFDIKNPKKLQANKLLPDLLSQITHIAVTAGPGLIGSLLVGFNTAKSLAYALNIPIIPINHIEGHIYSALAQNKVKSKKLKVKSDEIQFPILALTVSGGHTSLTLMRDHGIYENIGATIDDAAGEAFDKVAKLLDLGYPGGPIVSKLAKQFRDKIENNETSQYEKDPSTSLRFAQDDKTESYKLKADSFIKFPRPLLDRPDYNFSFSGLKTSVLYTVQKLTANGQPLTTDLKQQICYEFEEAVVDVLVTKTMRAAMQYDPKSIILAGGVSANLFLRKRLAEELMNQKTKEHDSIELLLPPLELCGDNAAMIGLAAYYHIIRGDISSWDKIKVDSNLKL